MTNEQIRYLKSFWNEIEQAAEELSKKEMPELKMEHFDLFFKTGNRLIYEGEYFGRRKYLTVYGILATYRKKQEDKDKLAEIISAVCDERFWALPAHVNGETRDELTIDLFAAETAQTLAEIVYLVGDWLPVEVVEKAFTEINRRVLVPFIESEVPYSWWETDRCNWSAVCAGSIGMAAIYMNRLKQLSDEKKEICIKRVCDALDCYLDGMEEDGACTEGLGYYSYGMSYYAAFAELLYQETDGAIDLMKKPKCEKIATFQQKCYFGGGVSVSFSDGSSKEPFLPGLTAYLAHCFPQVEIPDYVLARGLESDHCYRWLTNERNIRWLMAYEWKIEAEDIGKNLGVIIEKYIMQESQLSREKQKEPSYDLLPSAQWMICKNAEGNGFAAKGGHNDENHNHNDIGHFLCVYDGEMLLTDLGAGEYTKDYFSNGRYGILCNRSMGHSVPLINGLEQQEGCDYHASDFSWDEEKKELTISFGEAYPSGCIESIERKIQITDESRFSLNITDSFVLAEKTEKIVENLVTQYKPVVDKNCVFIKGKKGICCVEISGIESDVAIRVILQKHSNHSGVEEEVYLIQWSLPILEQKEIQSNMCITYLN